MVVVWRWRKNQRRFSYLWLGDFFFSSRFLSIQRQSRGSGNDFCPRISNRLWHQLICLRFSLITCDLHVNLLHLSLRARQPVSSAHALGACNLHKNQSSFYNINQQWKPSNDRRRERTELLSTESKCKSSSCQSDVSKCACYLQYQN